MRYLLYFLIFAVPFTLASPSWAIEEGEYRAGLIIGNSMQMSGLSDDVDPMVGYGVNFSYMFTENLVFDTSILLGSTDDLTHTELNLGIDYYYYSRGALFFSVGGGTSVVINSLKVGSNSGSATAGGLFISTGIDFDIARNTMAGFNIRYHNILEAKAEIASTDTTVAGSYLAILARVAYVF